MKENEKQAIEEMAAVIGTAIEFDELDFGMDEKTEIIAKKAAEAFYSKGYRKQSEGEWIEHEDDWCGAYYTCSACGCDWTTIDGTPQENNMRFCPECGAHMKGGEE